MPCSSCTLASVRRSWILVPCLVASWGLAQGCRTATEVTLDIRTNALCTDLTDVDIIVTSTAERAEVLAGYNIDRARTSTTTTTRCDDGKIGTLVVTPDGDRASVVVVAGLGVSASDCLPPEYGPQCIVARRAFAFTDHHAATLPIELNLDCRGVPCNALSTCAHGQCVTADVDCSGGDCTAPGTTPDSIVDGAPPPVIDGSPPSPLDAGSDASSDAGSDADGGDGGTLDAGTDGGGASDGGITQGSCGVVSTCLLNTTMCPYAPMDNQLCCYDTPNQAHCSFGMSPTNFCNGPAGCCRHAKDCTGGDVCCADTPVAKASTRFSCVPSAACPPMQQVCQNPFSAGECLGGGCSATPFGAGPGSGGYKRCQ